MRRFLLLGVLVFATVNASAQREFEFSAFAIPQNGSIVIPVIEGEGLTGVTSRVDSMTDGALSVAMEEASFTGASQTTLTLYGVHPFSRIDLIGLGSEPADRVSAQNFGGLAASLNDGTTGAPVNVLWDGINVVDGVSAAHVALGYQLRSYRFDRYQSGKMDRASLPVVRVLSDDASADARFNNDLKYLAEGIYMARDFSSEPANLMYPEKFVERAQAAFEGLDNVTIRVLDENELQRLGMGSHYSVGKGSERPPRLLIIEYMAGGDSAPVVLAGKGITFDSGGLSLKDGEHMWLMKGDLGGAGVVTATALAAAKRGEKINLVALAALAENMPSGGASRPGDVVTAMSGKTIEIRSTDAEGRLVLADAVYYGAQQYKPSVLIDVATLTGSVGRALGNEYAGIFGRHDDVIEDITAASRAAGENVWRLPLDASHFEQIKSSYADIINSGVGNPGASVGAAFIGSFVDENQVWAHLDIAGVDFYEEETPTTPMGYSGWGVLTLDQYLREHHASE
jgi:leucyl aminopeptidase